MHAERAASGRAAEPEGTVVDRPDSSDGLDQPRSRDPHVDALKGLAILLVVMGHAISVVARVTHAGSNLVNLGGMWVPEAVAHYPLFVSVYAFHMPLFAFVSGFVLWRAKPDSFLVQLRKRALGLLVPYFCWFLIYYLMGMILRSVTLAGLPSSLLSVVVNPVNDYALWYLWALFVCSMVPSATAQLPAERVLVVATAVIALLLPVVPGLTLPPGAYQVLYIYPYVAAGYLVVRMRPSITRHRWWFVAAGVAMFAPRLAVAIRPATFGFSLLNPAAAAVLIYVCTLAGAVGTYALYTAFRGPLLTTQAWVGRRSIGIYSTHSAIQVAILRVVAIESWFVMFLLSAVLSIIVTLVIERVPVARELLLGRRGPRSGGAA
jgi:fucose 4-O-acetylase-like acetyltransferase